MTVGVLTVGPGKLTIGADTLTSAFESQITEAIAQPKVDNDDPIHVLSGESVSGARKETWTLEGEMLQDYGLAASRSEWLFEHAGEEHPFTYIPANANGFGISGTLVAEATAIGGKVTEKATSEFEFVIVGRPTKIKPAA